MKVLFALLVSLLTVDSFYLPGVAPRDYLDGQSVELKVNKLDSVLTQLPYDFYSLPFCKPKAVVEAAENLGEILTGDMIENSPFELFMKRDETCKLLCKQTYTDEELEQFKTKVREEYNVNWIIDNMPVATTYILVSDENTENQKEELIFQKGFSLGFVGTPEEANTKEGVAYINNHVKLILSYHEDAKAFKGARIVGFQIEAFSHAYPGESASDKPASCTFSQHQPVNAPEGAAMKEELKTIFWTYDVAWVRPLIPDTYY